MPPKAKFNREEIIEAALSLVRSSGAQALTARALGEALGSSARPIFTVFSGMGQVQEAVLARANARYEGYLQEDMSAGKYPPYKASGMAYIRFARQERELFKLLFMRSRTREEYQSAAEGLKPVVDALQAATGLEEQEALELHLEIWIFAHGIATMIATGYLDWDEEAASRALTDCYFGLRHRFEEKKRKGEEG